MRTRLIVASLIVLALAPFGWATSNLNLSKSNLYSLTYPADLVTAANAKTMLAALDKMGPANEAKLKQWLAANFRRHGINGPRVKKVVILPPKDEVKRIAIILLTDPADEARAIATTVKSSKSNSSD